MFAVRALRLTCRRFAPMTTKRLFSHVHLLPTTDSANKARAVLENKELMPLVTTISIKASLDDPPMGPYNEEVKPSWDVPRYCENDPEYADESKHGLENNGVLSKTFKQMLSDIGQFNNLRRVEVDFDWEVVGETSIGNGGHHKEHTEYRVPFLMNVFRALNHPEHPAAKVHSLSICNLHDLSDYETLNSDDFKAVLSRIDTLELCIATEYQQHSPESSILEPESHRFFGKDLIEYWLAPVQRNLVNLKIYSNEYWGWLPKCDLRPLHFPQLKDLALGNMSFTHDWQLDWIISHGSSLESLTLDYCPIVHDALVGRPQDSERYVKLNDDYTLPQDDSRDSYWTYKSRWHDYFRKLATELPHLRRVRIGNGPWDSHWEYLSAATPFKAAASLPTQLEGARYHIYDYGSGPSAWIQPADADSQDNSTDKITELEEQYADCGWDEEDEPPRPSYPDCWDKDQEALNELVAVVESRKNRK